MGFTQESCVRGIFTRIRLNVAVGRSLKKLNLPGAGIHWMGDSIIDKTTELTLGASVWGDEEYIRGWRNTANGLEGAAEQRRVARLSSGENSFRGHLTEAGISTKDGQALRILDVPVSGKFGLFDRLHDVGSATELANALRRPVSNPLEGSSPK